MQVSFVPCRYFTAHSYSLAVRLGFALITAAALSGIPLAVVAQDASDRGELVLTNLPPRGSKAYKDLLALAGKTAKGQILAMTKSEMWSMPKARIDAVVKMSPKLGVKATVLGADWNHILKLPDDAMTMSDAQATMLDTTKSAQATMSVGMMSAPQSAVVEYALTKELPRTPATAPGAAKSLPPTIVIPINATESVTVRRTYVVTRADGCTWRGVIDATGEPVMLMWWKGGRISGMFNYRGRAFAVKNMGGEIHAVVETDTAKMPPDHGAMRKDRSADPNLQDDPLVVRGEAVTMRPLQPVSRDRGSDLQNRQDSIGDLINLAPAFKPLPAAKRRDMAAKKATIDVMVLYTKKAASNYIHIENDLIEVSIEQANGSFRSSGVGNVQLRLVHKHLTDYEEGEAQHFHHLYRMVDKGDGHMEEVFKLRDEKRADVVVLIVDDNSGCGLSTRVAAESEEAFAVVHHACAAMTYSLAHEIGHIVGARHDRSLDQSPSPFPYGHGYVNGVKWRDIMSYKASCNGCPRLPIWSNPTLKIHGDIGGTVNEDNARVILEQAERVSRFR